MVKRVVLAYSGGLDTSVAVRWMIEEWGVEVVCVAVDVGHGAREDLEIVRSRALAAIAIKLGDTFGAAPRPKGPRVALYGAAKHGPRRGAALPGRRRLRPDG